MKIRLGKRFWIVTTVIIVVFTVFVVGRNLLHAISIKRDIAALEAECDKYRNQIAGDSTLIERLQYDDYLEEYAREHYHMQRRDERVFIIKD